MNNLAQDLKNQRRGGFYWIDSKPYISVTTVLDIIDKPALRYWFGKEVYYAMVADPTLSEQVALAKPYEKSAKARDRGRTVHSIVEAYQHLKEKLDGISDDFKGYALAFDKWIQEHDMEIVSQEQTVISEQYNFAGTLDLYVKHLKTGLYYIIDVKTGKDIYPEATLQLSAYKQALSENGLQVDGIAVLLLKEDGSYKYSVEKSNLTAFRAAKALWEWRHPDILESLSIPSLSVTETKRKEVNTI